MAKLEYTFTNDTLFKTLFVRFPELLKKLVSELLAIRLERIGQFEITNPELSPERLAEKFCRLDVNMTVDGMKVDLEVQVANEGDYPERSLYYWAREYSSALAGGGNYSELPRAVVISIMEFKLFDCAEFHSEFQPLEVTRHTPLTDRMSLHYFELPKLPKIADGDNALKLWLALFKAKTEEEMKQVETLGGAVMEEAVNAYRHITTTNEFKEMERVRSRARHNEASALHYAAKVEREKWEAVVAEKDAALTEKDAILAEQAALIAELRKQIRDNN